MFCHDSCKCFSEVGAHRDIFPSCSSRRCGILKPELSSLAGAHECYDALATWKAQRACSVVHVVYLNGDSVVLALPNGGKSQRTALRERAAV